MFAEEPEYDLPPGNSLTLLVGLSDLPGSACDQTALRFSVLFTPALNALNCFEDQSITYSDISLHR